ncbi:MAG: O-antigen polymerase, partial [Candidatus Omnitrophota bacterium]
IFEFFVFVLIGFAISIMFSQGVKWENIQLVSALIAAGIAVPVVIEAKQRKIYLINAKSVIVLGLIYWVLLDPLTLREGLEGFKPEDVLKAFGLIIVFLITFQLAYLITSASFFKKIFRKLDYGYNFNRSKLYKVIIFSVFLGFLPILIWTFQEGSLKKLIWYFTHAGRWYPWGRGRWGGWIDYMKTFLGYFRIIGIQLTYLYIFFIKKNKIFILLLLINLWMYFAGGTRSNFGAAILPAIILYYFVSLNKKRKLVLPRLLILGVIFLSLGQLQLYMRDAARSQEITYIVSEEAGDVFTKSPTEYQRDDQFYRLAQYVSMVPEKIPHSGEWLIFRPLYHFIPRALWPAKPEGPTAFFEKQTNIAGVGMTTFSGSVIGSFYLAQGWLGVIIIGLFYGALAKQFDSLIEMARRSPAVLVFYSYGLIFLFVTLRGWVGIYQGWYAFIALYWLLKIVKKRTNQAYLR